MIALTFDDGPNPERTAPILDLLEQYHIPATFFVLGTSINETTSPLLQRMADMGCEIGIHGLTHSSMDAFSPLSLEKQLLEMKTIISDRIEGGYTPRLMRPPGGHYNDEVIAVAKRTELVLVMWSVDTLDWQVGKDEGLQKVKRDTKNGSIILCHDRGSGTLAAATEFIPYLLEQGYDFVTVSELLARYGAPAQPGTVYSSAVIR